jgi:hypothetical protein
VRLRLADAAIQGGAHRQEARLVKEQISSLDMFKVLTLILTGVTIH